MYKNIAIIVTTIWGISATSRATLFTCFFLPAVSVLHPFSIASALLLFGLSGLPGIQSLTVYDHVPQDLFGW